ncbi:MAG: isoleucine--tRNA ligase [Thaumarchaeota archaeon]|nr:isoleucine--tRNA ligase [Nitrososphaerota archaeon]
MKPAFKPKQVEDAIRSVWESINIRAKVGEARASSRKIGFVEGPPTLNGEPHIGHIRGRIIKDLWYRFNTLKGINVIFRAGWDTQGLPVELQAEKELGLRGSKTENLETVGLEALVKACKDLLLKYGDKWRQSDRLLGMSFDYDKAYWTYRDEYIEREWMYLQKAWETGLLGEGYRVVAYCPGCQTSLSHAEVAQGYEQLEDPSLYFKMKLSDEDAHLVLWTTMPFTVITDEMVGVKPDAEYHYVQISGETLVVAKNRLEPLMAELNASKYNIIKTVAGADLAGKKYIHPLLETIPGLQAASKVQKVHSIVAEDFVDITTGSGIVHMSPANGEIDFDTAQKHSLPVFNPIDDRLHFTMEAGVFGGLFVRDADQKVIEVLEKEGAVLKSGRIVHDYPACWRSHHRLVWVARREYFYWVDRLGDKAVEAAQKVEYFYDAPANRFLSIIKEKVPWCISRERVWGTPLPIWVCKSCQYANAVFSRSEIVKRALELPDGPDFELHRPWIDRVVLKCGKCGGSSYRERFVLDTWHNSGASPYASVTDQEYDELVPVEFLTEGIDQTRGWAYTLLIENVLLSQKPQAPYKAFLFQGHVLDEKGNKMSKSLGNMIEGLEVLSREPVDVLRFYLMWKAAPLDSLNFSPVEMRGRPYQILNTLYHLHVYFVQNSSYDGFDESTHILPWTEKQGLLRAQEQWLLSRLVNLVETVTDGFESCRYHEAARACEDFIIEDLSQLYIPLTRGDIWDDSPKTLSRRLAVYVILRHVLRTLDILLHPLSPYVTEYLYQTCFKKSRESVLLDDWPKIDQSYRRHELEEDFVVLREVISLSNAARMKAKLKRRWPLRSAILYMNGGDVSKLNKHFVLLEEQMNVKQVTAAKSLKDMPVKIILQPRYNLLGPKLKDLMSKVTQWFSTADTLELYDELSAKGSVSLRIRDQTVNISGDELELRLEPKEGYALAERNGVIVALLVERNRELIAEGAVRDLARRLQALRKERGFNPTEILDIAYAAGLDDEWFELLEPKLQELSFLVRVKEVRLEKDGSKKLDWSEAEIDGRTIKLYVGRN